MTLPLRILIVEDSADDAEVALLELSRGGIVPDARQVESASELRSALAAGPWDVVLSDYTMPGFGATEAFTLCRATDPDLPFVVVSGTIGEHRAVEMMRAGVSDYLLKGNLTRLSAVVTREVREAEGRRARRRAEHAAAHLASIVESSDDAIYSESLDGLVISWNPATERLYGWSAAEAIGRPVSILIPQDKIEELAKVTDSLRGGEPVVKIETVRLHRDGSRIDVSLTVSPIRNAAGLLIGVSKITRDIRERKQADVAVREREQLLQTIIAHIPCGVFWKDRDSVLLGCNNQFAKDFGAGCPEELIGKTDNVLATATEAAVFIARDRQVIDSGVPLLDVEEMHIRPGSGAATLLTSKVPLRGSDGAVVGVLGVYQDITDRKRDEAVLRFQHALLRCQTEASPDGMLVVDPGNRVLSYNRRFLQVWGIPDEFAATGDDTIVLAAARSRTADPDGFYARVAVIYADPDMQSHDEVGLADGRTLDRYSSPIRGDGGELLGRVWYFRDITERKQHEEQIRKSESFLRLLWETSADGMRLTDGSGIVRMVNEEYCRMVGRSREQLVGHPLSDIYTPELGEEILREHCEQFAARTVRPHHETEVPLWDGRHVWFALSSSFLDIPGNETLLLVLFRDVTDRVWAEEAVRASERRFLAFMDNSPAITFIKDEDGRYLYVNPTWLRQFDPEPVAWQGKTDFDFWPNETAIQTRASDRGCITTGVAFETEETARTSAGEEITWQVIKFPLGGKHRLIGGIVWDISERRRAEADLRLRDRAIRAATQGLVITDPGQPDGPLVYVSPGFERMTGYSAGEATGHNCRFLQGKDTDVEELARLRAAVKAGQPCTVELLNYRKDGTPFWNELSVSPVRDEAGRLTHYVGVQTDVSGRRKLEDQFRQAQKMEAVGQLAGGVAHDFNNLLTVINGYGEMVHDALPPDDPSRELVAEITKAGERAAGLTRQLLAFSRQTVLEPKVLDVNALVWNVEKMLRRLLGEDVDLATRLAPGIGRVKADPGQLEQAVVNMCVNARDAMPTGGRITVETRNVELDASYVALHPDVRCGLYVMVAVTDTGTGMTPEVQARIFDPFFTTKEAGKGTGLGLAMVFGFVKQSGGHVEVYSELGRGSTFKLYLPRLDTDQAAGRAGAKSGAMPQGTETVLLVEDEPAVRTLGRHILTKCGYTVMEAADGQEAVRVAMSQPGPIHLLVTDVVMPGGMGGREVAEAVVALHPETRVLFTSGYTDDAVVRHGVLEAGVHFLQKPFTPAALASKVRTILVATAVVSGRTTVDC